jgi:hypothetical protein
MPPHPIKRSAGLVEMDPFLRQYVDRGFRHANSSDAGTGEWGERGHMLPAKRRRRPPIY